MSTKEETGYSKTSWNTTGELWDPCALKFQIRPSEWGLSGSWLRKGGVEAMLNCVCNNQEEGLTPKQTFLLMNANPVLPGRPLRRERMTIFLCHDS